MIAFRSGELGERGISFWEGHGTKLRMKIVLEVLKVSKVPKVPKVSEVSKPACRQTGFQSLPVGRQGSKGSKRLKGSISLIGSKGLKGSKV
jgi:hypothetical protein